MKTPLSFVLTALSILSVWAGTASADPIPSLTLTRSVQVTEADGTHLYLGNRFGQTLYTFDLDHGAQSACVGACAEKWPPFLVGADEASALAAPFATITRASGLLQVTYNGSPVYTYYLDHVEGDDKGDSVGNVWHDIDFVDPTTPVTR